LLKRVRDWLAQPAGELGLTLDLQGSPFQLRVWQALQKVPAGVTVSYSDLAHRLNLPTASRAIAGACARNPVALAVPCHRVVRHDGRLSGYRWGVERKRDLLEREAAARAR
jgi:AraC family transcriptional regulator of adaptative response/methylated-DNA-[protein]-cysteine methyltransferase